MYANKMRDIHIANFVVDSDAVVRFRSKDDKVVVCDLLVGMRKYSSYGGAQRALITLIEHNDNKIAGLTSMEVDKTLFYTGNSIILMHFQDVVILFNRIGVRVVNDIVVTQIECVQGGVSGIESAEQDTVVDSVNIITIDPFSICNTPRLEHLVRDTINATFEGFIHNKVIPSSGPNDNCWRQIDHRLHIGNTILAIETDEHAHVNYNKDNEKRRYDEFTSTFPQKILFIRFNPHTNMEEQHANTDFKHKLGVLMRSIRYQMHRIRAGWNGNKLEIWTLFCERY